jgi:hypothetical protein
LVLRLLPKLLAASQQLALRHPGWPCPAGPGQPLQSRRRTLDGPSPPQVYGGAVFMDFDRERMEAAGHGQYQRLDPSLLPPLHLVYCENPSESGKVRGLLGCWAADLGVPRWGAAGRPAAARPPCSDRWQPEAQLP